MVDIKLDHVAVEGDSVMPVGLHTATQLEKLTQCTWDQTWVLRCAMHGVGLATTSLTISEDAHIVSI